MPPSLSRIGEGDAATMGHSNPSSAFSITFQCNSGTREMGCHAHLANMARTFLVNIFRY